MKLKHTTHGVLSTLAAGTLTAASITLTPPLADAQETSSAPTASNGNPILAKKYKNSFEHREHFVNDQGRIQYGEGEDALVCQPEVAEQFLPPEKIGTPGPHEMQLWNPRKKYGGDYPGLVNVSYIPLARFEVREKGKSSWVTIDRVPTREDLEKYGIGYPSLEGEFLKIIGTNSRVLNLDQSYDIPQEWWFSEQFLNRIDEAGYEIRPIESSSEGRLNPVVLYPGDVLYCGKEDTDADLPGIWRDEGWYTEHSSEIRLDELCWDIKSDSSGGSKRGEYYAIYDFGSKKVWSRVEDDHDELYHGGDRENEVFTLYLSVRSKGNPTFRRVSSVLTSQELKRYGLTYEDLERSFASGHAGRGRASLDSESIAKIEAQGFEVDHHFVRPVGEEKHAVFDGTSVSIIDNEGNMGESRGCVVKESEDPTTETSTETPPSDILTSTTAVPSTVTTTLPPSTVVTTVTPDPVTVTETPKTETTTATSEVTTTVTSTPPTKTTTLSPVTETVVTTETPEPKTSIITSTEKVPTTVTHTPEKETVTTSVTPQTVTAPPVTKTAITTSTEKVPTTVTQTPERETVTTSVTPPTVTAPSVTKTEITTSTEKVPTTVTHTPKKETVTTSVTPPTVTKNIPTTVVTQETVTETKEIPTTVVSTEPGTTTTEASTVTETPAPVTSTVVAETPTVTQPAPSTIVENGTAVVHLPEETVTVTPEPETPQQTPVQRVLASTGASVLGLLGVGAGIAALGAFMIRRKK